MSEKEKMINGDIYNSFDLELLDLRRKASIITRDFNNSNPLDIEYRKTLIKKLFGSIGESFMIEPRLECDYGFNVHVGNNFYMNYDCIILDVCSLSFGDDCMVGPRVCFYTAGHPTDPVLRKSGQEYGKAITIGNNCWIGGNSVINPGVVLGDNVVVGSGSVVTKSFPSDVVIAGNPAKVIKEL